MYQAGVTRSWSMKRSVSHFVRLTFTNFVALVCASRLAIRPEPTHAARSRRAASPSSRLCGISMSA